MRYYRLYCFDGSNRITGVHEVEAETDAEAIADAEAIQTGVSCELWDRDRLVKRFEHHQP